MGGFIGTGVVLSAAIGALTVAPVANARYVSPSQRDLVRALGGAPAQAGAARYAYLGKLDSQIQELAAGKSQGPATPGGPSLGGVTITPAGKALVDVYVDGSVAGAAQQLRGLGMDVTATSTRVPERMVEGYMPLSRATDVAALSSTKAVISSVGGMTDTGSVLSQGDAPQHGPQARALGATGAGVTVGVMSDSMNHVGTGIAGSQSSGDLPPSPGVTDLGDSSTGTDEGRAMGEIVYDEAPGLTNMVFDTGTTGAANKAADISALVSHGAKVIADDTFYPSEPFFQDGIVSQAVDQAVANGTAYIASAGNRARQSWEGTFANGGGGLNNFGGGDTRQAVADVPANATLSLTLQWNEPWGSAPDAFSINVYVNNVLLGTATPPTSGIPLVGFSVTAGGTPPEIEIEIHRTSGTGTPKLKYIAGGNFGPFSIKEHNTNSPTINADAAAAKGSLAVAAECWSTVQTDCDPFGPAGLHSPEVFSSRGPATRLRNASGNPLATPDVRRKPQVAGADGVATTVAGFGQFFGTSAAAPSVAGVAALALSARRSLTVTQLYGILTDPRNTIACTVVDPLDSCGSGLIQADKVVTAAHDNTPPTITPRASPSTPNGSHGWYTSRPVKVRWSVSDSLTPVLSRTAGCKPATFSANVKTVLTCTAASIGGTRTDRLGVKLDSSPPTRPTITGIAAKTYSKSKLPALRKIHCRASDRTSGVDSCKISGYSRQPGAHQLRATATNDAGLKSTRTLTYRVKRPRRR